MSLRWKFHESRCSPRFCPCAQFNPWYVLPCSISSWYSELLLPPSRKSKLSSHLQRGSRCWDGAAFLLAAASEPQLYNWSVGPGLTSQSYGLTMGHRGSASAHARFVLFPLLVCGWARWLNGAPRGSPGMAWVVVMPGAVCCMVTWSPPGPPNHAVKPSHRVPPRVMG